MWTELHQVISKVTISASSGTSLPSGSGSWGESLNQAATSPGFIQSPEAKKHRRRVPACTAVTNTIALSVSNSSRASPALTASDSAFNQSSTRTSMDSPSSIGITSFRITPYLCAVSDLFICDAPEQLPGGQDDSLCVRNRVGLQHRARR